MGTPVVTTDVGSITDLVIDGVTGFIARSGDPASLAKKIVELDQMLQDPEKSIQLIERAKFNATRHETQKSVSALADHLQKTIGNIHSGSNPEPSLSPPC
jgi:glycosyltransferase involved in cell wall biosynthesis